MDDEKFDAIVVGAGVAGLTCAAELVLRGRHPLLVCETSEVASTLRSKWVGNNRFPVQFLYLAQERFWYNQARELNIPMKLHPSGSLAVKRRGRGPATVLPYCPSAAGLTETVEAVFGFPSQSVRDDFERIMQAAFAIAWPDIIKMDRVPLIEWLVGQNAEEFTTRLVLTFAGTLSFMSPHDTAKHISVFGAMANFRTFFGLEGPLVMAEPDLREGYALLVAREIDRRGGEVRRNAKVRRVIVEDDRALGVEFVDGSAAHAPIVAIATGNSRIPKMLEPLPDDCAEAIEYSEQTKPAEFSLFTLLSEPVVPRELERSWTLYFDENGDMLHAAWPIEKMMPWTAEPGKQLVYAQAIKPSWAEVEKAGGVDGVWSEMFKYHEDLYPGFNAAVEGHSTTRHSHLWGAPLSFGPKLPRKSSDIAGLWFVGDGSRPIRHLYTEGAASAGILGAREIVQDLAGDGSRASRS